MWRTSKGDRVLEGAEWRLFREGLEATWESVEHTIENDDWGHVIEFEAFDRLHPHQQLALLCEVGTALRDPSVPFPGHTAHNEATIAAIYGFLVAQVEMEIDCSKEEGTNEEWLDTRKLILEADQEVTRREQREYLAKFKAQSPNSESTASPDFVEGDGDAEDDEDPWKPPSVDSTDRDEWKLLLECLSGRILWDDDYVMTDLFLDRHPLVSRTVMEQMGIDRDYYTAIAPDPTDKELVEIRRQLRMLCRKPKPRRRK